VIEYRKKVDKMASVVTHELVSNRPQSGGRKKVQYRFTLEDNDSATKIINYAPKIVPNSWDTDADKAAIAATMLESHASDEDNAQENPDFSVNSLTLVQNPKWSTSKRIAKKLIRLMMRKRDPRLVIWLEPLIVYLRTNYTTPQLSAFLNLTTDQLIKMNRSVNAILEDEGTVKDQLALFDADVEEVE